MMNPESTNPSADYANSKLAGSILIAVSLLAMLMLMHHPQVTTPDAGKAIAEIAEKAWMDRVVHGSLMVLLWVQVFCYLEFAMRLGFARSLVRAGLLAYAAGIFAMMLAASTDGFIVADIGVHYANARPEDIEAARHLLNLCGISVQVFTSLGAVAMSAGFIFWSIALLRAPLAHYWLGASGLLLAAAPACAILLGAISLNLKGAILVFACQTAWNLAVGVALVRGKV
jgi:hypothetical protein